MTALTDGQVVKALLAALAGGPVILTHHRMSGLVNATWPVDSSIWLNPDASADDQAQGLVESLETLRAPQLWRGGAS